MARSFNSGRRRSARRILIRIRRCDPFRAGAQSDASPRSDNRFPEKEFLMITDSSSGPRVLRDTLLALGIVLTTFYACFGDESPSMPERWPGFLGAGSTPIDPATLPLQWSPTTNVSWQAELTGAGQSSPVIWGDRVFVTTIDGAMKNDCLITAASLSDGTILWSYRTESAQPVRGNYFQSRSAPTPAVDAHHVYAFFETGKLIALTHEGKEAWVRNLPEEFGEFEVRIGLAASVAQTDDSVFVLVDHEGPSYLLSVDKMTGETKWKTERFSRQSYASPIVMTIAGQPQIVISSAGSIDGYDPVTGKQFWTMEGVGGNRSTTPLTFGDGRFLVSASPGMHDEQLDEASKSNFAMQVERSGDEFTTRVLWKAEKAMPSFGSPMVYQGLAYWVNNVGVIYCFDAETGEAVYTKRSGQLCWATPLGMGDHIYFFGKDGLTTVIAAGREYKLLAKNELIEGAEAAGEADVKRRESRGHQHGGGKPESAEKAKSDPAAAEATESTEKTPDAEKTEGATVPTTAAVSTAANDSTANDEKSEPSSDNSGTGSGRRGRGRGGNPEGSRRNGGDGTGSREGQEGGEEPRTRDGRIFADPVQYGYAAVNGSLVIRTGSRLYCLRSSSPAVNDPQAVKVSVQEGK